MNIIKELINLNKNEYNEFQYCPFYEKIEFCSFFFMCNKDINILDITVDSTYSIMRERMVEINTEIISEKLNNKLRNYYKNPFQNVLINFENMWLFVSVNEIQVATIFSSYDNHIKIKLYGRLIYSSNYIDTCLLK